MLPSRTWKTEAIILSGQSMTFHKTIRCHTTNDVIVEPLL
jgi:hypothetical protein